MIRISMTLVCITAFIKGYTPYPKWCWIFCLSVGMMADFYQLFQAFGAMKDGDPASDEAQAQVKRVQDFITENMYTCSNEILFGLGQWYVGGGEVTQNIDEMGGPGTAEFVHEAIKIYCNR